MNRPVLNADTVNPNSQGPLPPANYWCDLVRIDGGSETVLRHGWCTLAISNRW